MVDDEPMIANTLEEILRKFGFEADAAYSGSEAVIRAQSQTYDVLLTDVMMPGLNGIQAATEIRKTHPDCKVILVSGNANTAELLKEAEQSGMHFEVIAKPVHPMVIIERLQDIEKERDSRG